MANSPQLLSLQEWARRYGVKNPYDKSGYDYMYAYKHNIAPDKHGNWPELGINE
jgi:hypothetical protein|tara:strand:- start:2354 stop:2515 length:162 start_codon:yes stop_codon:yes gene_type:complete